MYFNKNHFRHLASNIPGIVLGVLLLTTVYALFPLIQTTPFIFSQREIPGERLGETTMYQPVLKDTQEARNAFNYFCQHRVPTDCVLNKFCPLYPVHCIFPTTSGSTTTGTGGYYITPYPTGPNSYITPYPTAPLYPYFTPIPTSGAYFWCWETQSFIVGFCKPSPTPIMYVAPTIPPYTYPTPYSGTTTGTTTTITNTTTSGGGQVVDWCYDSDGDSKTTRGVCRDARGTYNDMCYGADMREFVCEGIWNGREYTQQRCVPKILPCLNNGYCQIGICVQRTETTQTTTTNNTTQVTTAPTWATQVTIAPTSTSQITSSLNKTTQNTPTSPQKITQTTLENGQVMRPTLTPTGYVAKEQTTEPTAVKQKSPSTTPATSITKQQNQEAKEQPTPTIEVPVVPPVITAPLSGSIINGKVSIVIDTKLFSSVTILLQPAVSVDDRMYLGKVSTEGNKNIEWNTSFIPNGEYYIFAVAHTALQKYISDPIKIEVKNENIVGSKQTQLILPSKFKPEEVPIDNDTSMGEVETQTSETGQTVLMQGRAAPNTIVTILIYSNPVVVTVQADANGVWKYTLEEPLEAGEHTAYVVVPQEDGTQVRSAINTFIVPPVYASAEDGLNLKQGSLPESNAIGNFIVIAALLILDAIAILLFVYRMKNKKKETYVG